MTIQETEQEILELFDEYLGNLNYSGQLRLENGDIYDVFREGYLAGINAALSMGSTD